jgi:hypothetical protein
MDMDTAVEKMYPSAGIRNRAVMPIATRPTGSEGKVVHVLFLTEHHDKKAYWGSGDIAPLIL